MYFSIRGIESHDSIFKTFASLEANERARSEIASATFTSISISIVFIGYKTRILSKRR